MYFSCDQNNFIFFTGQRMAHATPQIPKMVRCEAEANSGPWEFQCLQPLIVPLPEVTSRPNNGQKASIQRGQEQIREVGFLERSFSAVRKLRAETIGQRTEE